MFTKVCKVACIFQMAISAWGSVETTAIKTQVGIKFSILAQGLKFPTISQNDLEKRKEFIRHIPLVWNKSWDDVIRMKWYLVPFQHVHSLGESMTKTNAK